MKVFIVVKILHHLINVTSYAVVLRPPPPTRHLLDTGTLVRADMGGEFPDSSVTLMETALWAIDNFFLNLGSVDFMLLTSG